MKRAGKLVAWAGLHEFIDEQVRPTQEVPVPQIERREEVALFPAASMNSVRVFISQVGTSLCLIKMFGLLTKENLYIKSQFDLGKPHKYSLNSVKLEVLASQRYQTWKLKCHKSTMSFTEKELENTRTHAQVPHFPAPNLQVRSFCIILYKVAHWASLQLRLFWTGLAIVFSSLGLVRHSGI